MTDWNNQFIDASHGHALDEVECYAIPIKHSPSWIESIDSQTNSNTIGLSALMHSTPILIPAIFPKDDSLRPYTLIRINQSRKIGIHNRKLKQSEYYVQIEEWTELPQDSLYLDVPKRDITISDFLAESVLGDEFLSRAIQATMISSPSYENVVGGVSIASLSSSSGFAEELEKTFTLMVPPEYRSSSPPKFTYNGKFVHYSRGIQFHVADRPQQTSNLYDTIRTPTMRGIIRELDSHYRHDGEYSLFSAILPKESARSREIKEIFNNFGRTEFTIPQNLDELIESDIEIDKARKLIDESLWIHIAHSRELTPRVNMKNPIFQSRIEYLEKSFDVMLSDIIPNETDRNYYLAQMITQIPVPFRKMAQSFARVKFEDDVIEEDLILASKSIIRCFDETCQAQVGKVEPRKIKNKISLRYKLIETLLLQYGPTSPDVLWDRLESTEFFRDMKDLMDLLKWARRKDKLFIDNQGRYGLP